MVRLPAEETDFSLFQKNSDRLWSTHSLFLSGHKNFVLRGNDGVGMELTTNLHLPMLRMSGVTFTLTHALL